MAEEDDLEDEEEIVEDGTGIPLCLFHRLLLEELIFDVDSCYPNGYALVVGDCGLCSESIEKVWLVSHF